MKKSVLALTLLFSVFHAISQDKPAEQEEPFKPYGKPIITVFANGHTIFQDGNSNSGFQLTRGYLGYEYNFSENFSGKVVFDIGNVGLNNYQMISFVKYAMVSYKHKNLSINFGLIPTIEFGVQEKFWGYRYIEKSYMDRFGFSPSADLGASVSYEFNDIVSVDFGVFNGEGYKLQQFDNFVKTALGVTVTPIKQLTVRLVADVMGKDSTQITYGGFIGYKIEKFSVGGEYNYQQDHFMRPNHNYYGPSVYSTYVISKKFKIFARYDNLQSNKPEGDDEVWNFTKDGQFITAGFEYAPIKGIKISPNYQGWIPTDNSEAITTGLFFNIEVKL